MQVKIVKGQKKVELTGQEGQFKRKSHSLPRFFLPYHLAFPFSQSPSSRKMTQSVISPEQLAKHNPYNVDILRYVTMFATGAYETVLISREWKGS